MILAFPKQGFLLFPGAELAGEVFVAYIHIPAALAEQAKTELITREMIRQDLPQQPVNSHKGSFGKVLL